MWMYLGVFLGSLAVDLIPIAAPPAWTVMVFFILKFDLNPWGALAVGVVGSTLGRYIFSLYIPKVSRKILKHRKEEELEFVGKKLGGNLWRTWIFVLIYTMTPLSTTALFTAVGMAKIKPTHTLPPFFVGKFASDAIMILTGRYLAGSGGDLLKNLLSPKSIITLLLGLILIGGILFIDWFELLQKKKLKLKFKIWKRS
jgi:membrane protein DedA with SNARE-associated domain